MTSNSLANQKEMMVTSRSGFIVATIVFVFLSYCASAQDRFITNEELRSAFDEGDVDRIIMSLNIVKQMSYQGEALRLLLEMWQGESRQYTSEIATYVAELPIVRMEIANVLLQAERNRMIEFDSDSARAEALTHINTQDVVLLNVVISNLSIIDNEDDIEVIKQVAMRKNPPTFRSAVLGLSTMCGEYASLALDELEPIAARIGEREHLLEVRESMAEVRSILCR